MLSEQARLRPSSGKDANNLLIQACAKYQKAFNVDKTHFELLYNWGHALLSRGKTEEDGGDILAQAGMAYCVHIQKPRVTLFLFKCVLCVRVCAFVF